MYKTVKTAHSIVVSNIPFLVTNTLCDCSPHQFWFTSYLSAATRSMVGALRPGRTSVISVSYKLKHAICVTTLDWYTHTVSNFLQLHVSTEVIQLRLYNITMVAVVKEPA